MKDILKLIENALQLNEMAKIAIVDDKQVKLNSKDHGLPHFHYGKYKILLTRPLQSVKDIQTMTITAKLPTETEARKLLLWLQSKNSKKPQLTNFEVMELMWSLFHD